MKVTYLMVITYISCCVGIATKPCKYFQLNAPFFHRKKGIFSKLSTDRLIPPPWRLAQCYLPDAPAPQRYPVFVKPEWSQNARGVFRADNAAQLADIREKISGGGGEYLLQEGATEANEYEIFSIQHHRHGARYAVLTVTQACNQSEDYPVNSIYNENTRYVEITDSFSTAQLDQLWTMMRRIGTFKIARISVRADSGDDLLRGNFHVIEINLFLPMPINLLDRRHSRATIVRLVMTYMLCLARATKSRDQRLQAAPVFIKSMLYNRRSRLLNLWRARL